MDGRDLTSISQSTNCPSTPSVEENWPVGLKIDGVVHLETNALTPAYKYTTLCSSHSEDSCVKLNTSKIGPLATK